MNLFSGSHRMTRCFLPSVLRMQSWEMAEKPSDPLAHHLPSLLPFEKLLEACIEASPEGFWRT